MTEHLSQQQLLRYLDGELSKSSMSSAVEHLHSCWTCRAELDRIEKDIASILAAQEQVFAPSLPAPPRPWPRLEPRLRAREEASTASWRRFITPAARALRPALPFATAAMVVVLIVALIWLPVTSVSAKEVLRRVEVANAKRLEITNKQVIRERLRVRRIGRRSAANDAARFESWKSSTATYWNSREDAVIDLCNRYRSFGIADTLPLSATALEKWTTVATSEPSASRQPDGTLDVRITADASEAARGLEEVSLHVRPENWHVDEMRLSFVDAVFEIGEEGFAVVEQKDVPKEVLAFLEPPAMPSLEAPLDTAVAPPLPRLRPAANVDDLELGVRCDLHRIGADLGEGVDVSSRPAGDVVVSAWGLSPERQTQLMAMLDGKPGVRLEFQPQDDSGGSPAAAGRVIVIPQAPGVMQQRDDRLVKFFGSAETEENYTRTVLRASTDILSHFYALRALADRWPAGKDSHLSAHAKAQLSMMIRDHAEQLRAKIEDLQGQLGPLAHNFGYDVDGRAGTDLARDWQEASISGLDAAKRADHVLRALLTTSESPASVEDALPRLQQGLQDVDRAVRGLVVLAK